MGVVRAVALFVLVTAAELGGTWLVWQGIRGNRSWFQISGGSLVLVLYGLTITFQGESSFGRITAAYGGLLIAGVLVWGIVADGYRSDHWDPIGAGICLIGTGVIMSVPRGRGIWKVPGLRSTQTRNRGSNGPSLV